MTHHNNYTLAEGLVKGKKSHKQLQSAADTLTPRQFNIPSENIILLCAYEYQSVT